MGWKRAREKQILLTGWFGLMLLTIVNFPGLDSMHATAQSKSNYPKTVGSMRLKSQFSNWKFFSLSLTIQDISSIHTDTHTHTHTHISALKYIVYKNFYLIFLKTAFVCVRAQVCVCVWYLRFSQQWILILWSSVLWLCLVW
jgi:hypothetical protein